MTKANVPFRFEKTDTFFPDDPMMDRSDLTWGYLHVPENWNQASGKQIQLAVAVLRRQSEDSKAQPLVFIDGGPGDAGMQKLWYFIDDALQQDRDIIVLDLRGTGFSKPQLCPDLGETFFEILAADQDPATDEEQKITAALSCRDALVQRGIDIRQYHSRAIAQDLNALRQSLGYEQWHVFGVSYGTHVAQVYAEQFPEDLSSLILDSSIPDIENYYTSNTSNYLGSLQKVFRSCSDDPACQMEYPNLEEDYYAVIADLSENPIEVEVEASVSAGGRFHYNAEDFKIAIQQSLYRPQLIKVIPLMITAFKERKIGPLSNLVAAFSGALGLDYGAYYCMTCNEVMPRTSYAAYQADAGQYQALRGGLSFYKSDFLICDRWNEGYAFSESNDSTAVEAYQGPVLVFAGKYDPITPSHFGPLTAGKYAQSTLVEAPSSGHGPGASLTGFKIINEFVNDLSKTSFTTKFKSKPMNFAHGITWNTGVSQLANSLGSFNLLFFFPLLIAVVLLLVFCLYHVYQLLRRSPLGVANRWMNHLLVLSSLIGIITFVGFAQAINQTAADNLYLLAFGIPEQYSYLFSLRLAFVVLLVLTSAYFFLRLRRLQQLNLVGTLLFSNFLLFAYFFYWGFG